MRRGVPMRRKKLLTITLFIVAVAVLFVVPPAQTTAPVYTQIATIALPGGLFGFDIAWVDPSEKFYLTDRTATKGTGRIDVADAQTNKLLYTIPTKPTEFGFVGNVPTATPG